MGYSALAQKHEALALELLDEQRTLLRSIFPTHGGREIEAVGDGFFVEFTSALDGTRCGIEIQQSLNDRNATAPPERQVRVRIGLHLGDVVVRGDRVHGDGVNIAARIEPLAGAGGISLSEDVARQVQNKLELPLRKLGKGELKNIQLPVDIYRVVLPWERRHLLFSERLAFAFRRKRPRRDVVGAAVLLVILAVGGAYVSQRSGGPLGAASTRRVAVLPFANMSGNADDEYFSDGITEELISRLSRVAGLEVIARTSVMSYKGTAKKVPEIGRELSVGSILEGSVRKAGNKVRITAQLIHADTQAHLWSEDYDRDLTDIFAVQGDIAQRVADALRVKLGAAERQQLAKKGTDDPEAYALYLKGRYSIGKQTEEGIRTGIDYFEQAIAKDPAYALAYAGLGDSYLNLAFLVPTVRPREAYPKAAATASKALELDDTLAEAHSFLATCKGMFEWDWSGAEAEHRRAVSLNPNSATVRSWYAVYLMHMGQFGEAVTEARKALELDPVYLLTNANYALYLYVARKYDQAIEQSRKTIQMEPTSYLAYSFLGYGYAGKGMWADAIAAFEKEVELLGRIPFVLTDLAYGYARAGKRAEALKVIAEMEQLARASYLQPGVFVGPFLGLGDTPKALEWLQKGVDEHDSLALWYARTPVADGVRADPRFIAVMRKMGFEK